MTSPWGKTSKTYSFFFWFNLCLLRDIDTIKELSVILWTSLADLVDTGSTERNCSIVWTIKDELILADIGWGKFDSSSTNHLNKLILLSSQEVLDENRGTILGTLGIDWEMRVTESHLVAVALGDTSDHVFDKRFEGIDSASLLVASEPHADSDEKACSFIVILF